MGRRIWVALLFAPYVVVCLITCVPPRAGTTPRDLDLDRDRKADRHGELLPRGAVARLGRIDGDPPGRGSHALAFSPDGALLAFVANDGDTRISDIRSETELHRLARDPTWFPNGTGSRVFTLDGKLLLGDGGAVWDVATGAFAARFVAASQGNDMLSLPTPSPDGKSVLFVKHPWDWAGEVIVFDLASRQEIRRFGAGTRAGIALVFSLDGRTLATAKVEETVAWPLLHIEREGEGQWFEPPDVAKGGLLLWDPHTGRKKAEWISGNSGQWTPVGFSADGQTLHVLADERLLSWDLAAGKPPGGSFGSWLRTAIQLADGKTLAASEVAGLALWSIPGKKQLGRVERPLNWVVDMASSPTGRWLATGGRDGTVLVWDVAALRAMR